MPHSLSSLHMIYPEDAFDGYDLIFSAGPHHCDEFREITKARGLKNFGTVPIGYGKLDVLRQELVAKKKPPIQVLTFFLHQVGEAKIYLNYADWNSFHLF